MADWLRVTTDFAIFRGSDSARKVIDQFWGQPFRYVITEVAGDEYEIAPLTMAVLKELGREPELTLDQVDYLFDKASLIRRLDPPYTTHGLTKEVLYSVESGVDGVVKLISDVDLTEPFVADLCRPRQHFEGLTVPTTIDVRLSPPSTPGVSNVDYTQVIKDIVGGDLAEPLVESSDYLRIVGDMDPAGDDADRFGGLSPAGAVEDQGPHGDDSGGVYAIDVDEDGGSTGSGGGAGEPQHAAPEEALAANPPDLPGQVPDKSGLSWITSMPRDEAALRQRTLFASQPYQFETGLTTRTQSPPGAAHSTVGEADELLGSAIAFTAKVSGPASLNPVGRDRADGETETELTNQSVCTATGTEPFVFVVEANAAGTVVVEVSLVIDSAPFDEVHEFEFLVLPSDSRADSKPMVTTTDEACLEAVTARVWKPLPADVWLQQTSSANEFGAPIFARPNREESFPLFAAATSGPELEDAAASAVARLDQLAGQYPTTGISFADSSMLEQLATIGAELHLALFGDPDDESIDVETKDAARYFAELGLDGNPPLVCVEAPLDACPWGILYDVSHRADPQTDQAVDPLGFWGTRFALSRLARRASQAHAQPTPESVPSRSVQAFVNPDVEPHSAVERQDEVLNGLVQEANVAVVVGGSKADLQKWIVDSRDDARSSVVYFYCHATAARRTRSSGATNRTPPDEQATISLNNNETITIAELNKMSRGGIHAPQLGLLNACNVGMTDPVLANPFVRQFIRRWGTKALVASDAQVPALFGPEFGDRLLRNFLGGDVSIAECLRHTALDLITNDKNPFGLIFAVHGESRLTADWMAS
ncbi:MAG: hypothetical protein ACXV95_00020 [Acidimicrobiales bacterium]